MFLSRSETLISNSSGSDEPHAAARTAINTANPAEHAMLFWHNAQLNLDVNSQSSHGSRKTIEYPAPGLSIHPPARRPSNNLGLGCPFALRLSKGEQCTRHALPIFPHLNA